MKNSVVKRLEHALGGWVSINMILAHVYYQKATKDGSISAYTPSTKRTRIQAALWLVRAVSAVVADQPLSLLPLARRGPVGVRSVPSGVTVGR